MGNLTKAQKAAKISEAKELVISMTKSSGLVMLPANETFDVSIEANVTIDSMVTPLSMETSNVSFAGSITTPLDFVIDITSSFASEILASF